MAANNGFALVEAAFVPASRGMGLASFWLIATVSLGTLAAAAGVTIAENPPPATAVAQLSAAPEAAAPILVPSALIAAPEQPAAAPAKNLRVLPVVLRGQPASRAANRL